MSKTISLINGPNLNLLGTRRPEIYGSDTLDSIIGLVRKQAEVRGYKILPVQSNSEGAIVDALQQAGETCSGILINAAAYSHTSIAIRDALESIQLPVVEVHLSNIFKRETFRQRSLVSEVAQGVICGFGPHGYLLGLDALIKLIEK